MPCFIGTRPLYCLERRLKPASIRPGSLPEEESSMQIEGVWTMEYFGLAGWRDAGIVVFKDGTVTGGNNHHFFLGTYEQRDGIYNIRVEITFIEAAKTLSPVEGRFPAQIEGKLQGSLFTGSVSRSDIPGFHLPIRLTKRYEP
jgi:hypothetical protein